ncbi:MAG: PKD domain-containing protein, partial [Gammaproteobacteria bacterium]|nr:PKD domain-containing protein [Gammaproteobacteria bacterium]
PEQQSASVVLPSVNETEVLVFELTVSDPSGASSTDAISVTVNNVADQNTAPVADAGSDQSGDEGARLSLSGDASRDADGDPLSFSWRQTSGPAATISNSQSMTTNVTLPQVTMTTILTIELTVTDTGGASATDTMSITVNDVSSTDPTNPSNGRGGSGAIGIVWLIMISALVRLRSSNRQD